MHQRVLYFICGLLMVQDSLTCFHLHCPLQGDLLGHGAEEVHSGGAGSVGEGFGFTSAFPDMPLDTEVSPTRHYMFL